MFLSRIISKTTWSVTNDQKVVLWLVVLFNMSYFPFSKKLGVFFCLKMDEFHPTRWCSQEELGDLEIIPGDTVQGGRREVTFFPLFEGWKSSWVVTVFRFFSQDFFQPGEFLDLCFFCFPFWHRFRHRFLFFQHLHGLKLNGWLWKRCTYMDTTVIQSSELRGTSRE